MKLVNISYDLEFVEHCEISNMPKRQVFKFFRQRITGKIAMIMELNHTLQLALDKPTVKLSLPKHSSEYITQ